jgi:hypothetical protein
MNLKDAMSDAILRTILARPDRVPKPLLEAAKTVESARAEWEKGRANWEVLPPASDWALEDKILRKVYENWFKAEKNFSHTLEKYVGELPAILGENARD